QIPFYFFYFSTFILLTLKNWHHNQPPVITWLARSLNDSGENASKNSLYFTLSQISILLPAGTSTMSFWMPAYSFSVAGNNILPALSGSTSVASFKKYRLNCLTFGSKSFKALIFSAMGSQELIGYRLKHFSNPLFMTKRSVSPSTSCFLKPAGRRKRPFASTVASNSPRKPVINRFYSINTTNLTQNNTFSHLLTKFYPF